MPSFWYIFKFIFLFKKHEIGKCSYSETSLFENCFGKDISINIVKVAILWIIISGCDSGIKEKNSQPEKIIFYNWRISSSFIEKWKTVQWNIPLLMARFQV